MDALLHDSYFWVLLATVIFAAIAFRFGRKPVTGMLDSRTERIRKELEEAQQLKEEAQELLAEYQKKHRDAIHTAQKILDAAKENAERLEREARGRLEETLERRENQLIERLARAEAAAVEDIRTQAADIAVAAAARLLQDQLPKKGGKLIDDAIADLPARLN